MDIEKILQQYKNEEITGEQAKNLLSKFPYEDLSFVKIDHQRKERTGMAEVILAQGKTPEQTAEIFEKLAQHNGNVMATRATKEHYTAVKKLCDEAVYDETSRIIYKKTQQKKSGLVAVCTGGTADIPVAEEAAITTELSGAAVERFYDVGVAGIHRLFDKIEQIRKADVIIAVAGMEGALPSVLAGLVSVPVIAVPTSIGYGANFGGLSALLTMINSCAAGVSVVNIDNGFGAGYIAAQIIRGNK